MPAGRRAKPQIIKELQGTARADRTNARSPQYKKINRIPAVPPQFKKGKYAKQAQALWRRICGMLSTVGLLDEVNIDLVVLYVSETMTYRQAMDELGGKLIYHDPTTGAPKKHPLRLIASDAMKNIMTIAREFGFTPSTSQKIISPIQHNDKKKNIKKFT